MTLIDDYLRAVALMLPKDKRDDIVDELRELILSRVEAREAELGRRLTDDETEQVLRQIGHPLVVASRYRDEPQSVVGPTLYPYWMFAVKVAVTLQAAVAGIVFLVRAVTGMEVVRAFDQAVASAVTGSVMLIGIATIVAWLVERNAVHIRYLDRWRVRDLRFLELAAWDPDAWRDWFHRRRDGAGPHPPRDRDQAGAWRPAGRPTAASSMAAAQASASPPPNADPYDWGKRARDLRAERDGAEQDWRRSMRRYSPVGHGLGAIAWGVVFLLWWLGALHFGIAGSVEDFRSLGLEPGPLAGVDWAGLKASLYLPVLAYVGLVVAQGAVRIAHPDAVRIQGLLDLVIAAVVLATGAWLWTLSPLAPTVRVDSLAGFAQRLHALFEDGPPFPMGPAITLLLAICAFGGVIRGIKGFWELVLPAPFAPPPYRLA